MLRKMLARAGQRCSEAVNGRQALDSLGENRPDLIFLDLMMPVMDGFEFLEAVAQREDWQDIPIVVVSAKDLTPRAQAPVRTGPNLHAQGTGKSEKPPAYHREPRRKSTPESRSAERRGVIGTPS